MPREKSLNVIGLISGGKDSFFSLLHCLANGHSVIALANLYPPAVSPTGDEPEDLNSFMYQTVGHAVIPSYAEALDLPMYRQEILGSALNQAKDYETVPVKALPKDLIDSATYQHQEETESLIPLLQMIIAAHPTANAICSGAILSSYQRTRIESVARRLGLIPLSYLWQYPRLPPPSPGRLLDDMAAIGFDVRIVKVASGGLDGTLLWCNLLDPAVRRRVERGLGRFGGSVLGEGGEYETLVIDGPTPFWKGRIDIQHDELWTTNRSGGDAWVEFKERSGAIVKKENKDIVDDSLSSRNVNIPSLLNVEFDILYKKVSSVPQNLSWNNDYVTVHRQLSWMPSTEVCKTASTLTVHNVNAPYNGTTAGEQMLAINSKLINMLMEHDISDAENTIFTTLLLRSMEDFTPVNDIYGALFTRPNPPARVTIACGDSLPPDVHVMVSFVIGLDRRSREGLHVQSRSYWAPANIGPYSQAISVPLQQASVDPRLVYIAGQIPLVPASMDVLQGEQDIGGVVGHTSIQLFAKQACLALQHLWRCGDVMGVNWWTGAVAFIIGEDDVHMKAMVAWKAWEEVHQMQLWEPEDDLKSEDEVDGFDVWDKKYGGLESFARKESEGHRLPDFKRMPSLTQNSPPHFLAVQIDGLPRGCEIEWQSSGIAYRDSSTSTVEATVDYIDIPHDGVSGQDFSSKARMLLNGRMSEDDFDATVYTTRPDRSNGSGVHIIPCRAIWGSTGTSLVASIVIRNRAGE